MQDPEVSTPQPSTAITPVPLVNQAHGGKLRRGGTNRGGMGKVPTAIRKRARETYWGLMPRLESIASGGKVLQTVVAATPQGTVVTADTEVIPKVGDQLKASEQLAKIGLGPQVTVEDVRERLERQNKLLLQELAPEVAERILDRLSREVWRT